MDDTPVGDVPYPSASQPRWQQWADQLARHAWLVLRVAVALALVGGAIYAAAWQPATGAVASVDECVDPPCFGDGGLPGIRDLPVVIPVLGYLLAIVLGLPNLLAGAWDLLRGRRAAGGGRLLVFVGPALVLIGLELIPHLVSPCTAAWAVGRDALPGICERTAGGVDITDRWHLLDHALVGALPLAALYGLALRRWHPAIGRGH